MKRPQVIFLDAVGTLFGVKGSVGEIYASLASKFGVEADPALVNQAFFKSFRSATPMAFPGVRADDIPEREFAWWWAIAADTFQQVGVLNRFSSFAEFFTVLYDHFKTAEPWFVYPDTLESLKSWKDAGIELGVLSNFDSRLYPVLDALQLSDFFQSVTISTEVGAAKPNPKVFQAALQKHNCPPEAAWHVGDSFKEDYEGAKAIGMRAIWLRRD